MSWLLGNKKIRRKAKSSFGGHLRHMKRVAPYLAAGAMGPQAAPVFGTGAAGTGAASAGFGASAKAAATKIGAFGAKHSGLIAAGAGLGGQALANAGSAKQAERQMDFQERMSSTAHQRQVEDLKAAGLNPILSANSGASAPGGAMGQVGNIGEAGVSSAVAARRSQAEVAVMNATTRNTEIQTKRTNQLLPYEQGLMEEQGWQAFQQQALASASAMQLAAQTHRMKMENAWLEENPWAIGLGVVGGSAAGAGAAAISSASGLFKALRTGRTAPRAIMNPRRKP